MTKPQDASEDTVMLWDPVTRILHWALVICVLSAWGLGKFGPNIMSLHFIAGYAVLTIVILRIIWGVIGPYPVRFTSFLRGPRAIGAYARRLISKSPSNTPGHNPIGALFILLILIALLGQVATGLFTDPEDYINTGPLAKHVSLEAARSANAAHALLSNLIVLLIIGHITAIAFYRIYKSEDLITPMIRGGRRLPHPKPQKR